MNALTSTEMLASTNLSTPADDATIIALATEMLAGEQRLADWDADRCELTTEEAVDLSIETGRQSGTLMRMQPATLSALAAKVEALRATFRCLVIDDPDETVESAGEHSDQIAWAVFADVLRLAGQSAASNPDAALIAACEEYLRIQRAFEAYYDTLPGDMEESDPGAAILDPIPALVERIGRLQATTAEGHWARSRCVSFHYRPGNLACRDMPNEANDDRFAAAGMRDLVRYQAQDSMPPAAPNPDAALLSLCHEITVIDAESDRLYSACPEEGGTEAWEAYNAQTDMAVPRWQALTRNVAGLPSQTPEGLCAKARAARDAMPKYRREEPEPYEMLALSLIADVLGESRDGARAMAGSAAA